jgi:hypothetical protein
MDPIERALETVMDGPDLTHAMGYHINARGELVREKRYHVIFHSILNIVYLMLWKIDHLINRVKAMKYQVDMIDMMEVEDMCRQINDQEPSDDLPLGPPLCEDNTLHLFPITRAERRSVIKLRKNTQGWCELRLSSE